MKEKNKTKKSKTKVSTGIAAEEKRQSTETLVGVLRRPRYEVFPLQGLREGPRVELDVAPGDVARPQTRRHAVGNRHASHNLKLTIRSPTTIFETLLSSCVIRHSRPVEEFFSREWLVNILDASGHRTTSRLQLPRERCG
jgi:hypothetical protein